MRTRSSLASGLAVSALLLSSSSMAAPKFLGWHPGGGFSYQADGDKVQVCREDTSDIPAGWPEGVQIGPGAACGDVPAQVGTLSALDYAKKDTKGQKTEKKSPFGLDVKLDASGATPTVLVVDGPDKKLKLGDVDAKDAKLGAVVWRPDGRAVAVSVTGAKPALFVGNVSSLLVGGPAGRKLAQRLVDEGQKLYKKRDWSGAGKLFEDAIAADGNFAAARFARAAAEAQGGVGRSAMIENLTWLKEHADKDAQAKKLLAQAKDDAAFDAWVGEPEVRELVGLPRVSSMDVPARLLERKGTWTLQGATCKSPWVTLQMKALKNNQGPVVVTVADSCKGKKTQKAGAGTLQVTSTGAWEIVLKKPIEGSNFPQRSTIVLDEGYQQLKLQSGDQILGTFEPGAARIDDSTL
jgi:hypothetical protein